MSAISGNGGFVVITVGTVATTFDNSNWTVDPNAINADVTNSATGLGQLKIGIRQQPTWSIDAPLDSAQLPETIGLSGTARLTKIYFNRGAATVGERCSTTNIDSLSITDDENDAVRIKIAGSGGLVVNGVTN